jgi:hypothetical protein
MIDNIKRKTEIEIISLIARFDKNQSIVTIEIIGITIPNGTLKLLP